MVLNSTQNPSKNNYGWGNDLCLTKPRKGFTPAVLPAPVVVKTIAFSSYHQGPGAQDLHYNLGRLRFGGGRLLSLHRQQGPRFFHCSFGTAGATAAGLKAGYEILGRGEVTVLAWAGDGGTFDIGLQSLSGAAERNDDILYVCYDNEAYMNTGGQRSSATPRGSWTTTTPARNRKQRPKKDLAAIVAAHGVPYLATASISDLKDLEAKVRKANNIKGFKFIHVLVPCPTGWLFPAKYTIRMARLAVASRVFPLFEVTDGDRYVLSPMDDMIPVDEYLEAQKRFKAMVREEIEQFSTRCNSTLDQAQSPGRLWMIVMLEIKIAGRGGQGVVLASQLIAEALYRKGFFCPILSFLRGRTPGSAGIGFCSGRYGNH